MNREIFHPRIIRKEKPPKMTGRRGYLKVREYPRRDFADPSLLGLTISSHAAKVDTSTITTISTGLVCLAITLREQRGRHQTSCGEYHVLNLRLNRPTRLALRLELTVAIPFIPLWDSD